MEVEGKISWTEGNINDLLVKRPPLKVEGKGTKNTVISGVDIVTCRKRASHTHKKSLEEVHQR